MKAVILRFISAAMICALLSFAALGVGAAAEGIPFRDVSRQSWYEDGAVYCFEHGYIEGTLVGVFSPKDNLSRAMAVQILYSMNGENTETDSKTYTDVGRGKWYFEAVEWAHKNDVAHGTGGTNFSPSAKITRQDFVTMLYSFNAAFDHHNETEPNGVVLSSFTDIESISDYAADAMEWAVGHGLVSGYTDNTLRPKSNITRAETATVIAAFDRTFGHRWQADIITPRTCESDGHTEYSCTSCGAKRTVITKGYHLWNGGEITSEASCFTPGVKTFTCISCGGSYTTELPAAGTHLWDGGRITTPAKCNAQGVKTFSCKRCGETYAEVIPALGYHVWGEWIEAIPADIYTTGTMARYCWHCGTGEAMIYRCDSYYPILPDEIDLPSGGYELSRKNIGMKVIYTNIRLLSTDSASFTASTFNAVKRFQRSCGLAQTGIVDLATWLAMGYSEYDWYNLGRYITPRQVNAYNSRQDHINTMINVAWDYANAGTVYRIGCSGPPGSYADCSGLIYQCLYAVGIDPDTNIIDHALAEYEYTSRWLAADPKLGLSVPTNDLEPGDLVFYAVNGRSTVVHVALYAGDGMIYDAWPKIGTTYRSIEIPGYYVIKAVRVFP